MRVCHLVPSLENRHGGPSVSVRALANAMALTDVDVSLLTTHPAAAQSDRTPADLVPLRSFPREMPQWLCRSPQLQRHLRNENYDCVHSHALWLLTLRYAHQAAARHAVPLVISPRGMMSGWAYQHRRWRKQLAELFVHPGAFRAAAGWHATSAEEAADIRKLGFTQPICISPNGVELPGTTTLAEARRYWRAQCPASGQRPVALFFSRLHRKKRLRELIDLWCAEPRGDWFLLIVGVPEDYSVAEVEGWIAKAGAQGNVAVFDGSTRPAPIGVASLFLLPSHSENFGLVIAEALAAGVPALVTHSTPWQGLSSQNAGWCVSWEEYPNTLRAALATEAALLAQLGTNGRAWMARDFTWEKSARLLTEFYRELPHG